MTLDDLARLQLAFAVQMDCAEPCAAPMAPWLDADERTTRRLARYGDALRQRRERSLVLVFPVLAGLVGELFFGRLSNAYGGMYPSRNGDLARFGVDLATFIDAWPAARKLAWLADLARLEWSLHEVHGAPDARPLAADDLRDADPADVDSWPLRLHPAAVPHASDWRTVDLWRAGKFPRQDALAPTLQGATHAIVHRDVWTPTVREVAPPEWAGLSALARVATLGEALLAAQAVHERGASSAVPFDAGALFSRWMSDGLLVRA